MTNEERIALVLDIKGVESINALNKSLDDQKKELKDLAAAWQRGEMSAKDYLNVQNQLQAEITQTKNLIMQLKGTGAGGAGGQGVMAMSYAFQDFTSQIRNGVGPALASIQNNIPGMLVGTGLSNPMIAAISAISVALGLVAPAIIKAFGQESTEEIDKAKEKLKEFEEQVKKTHAEFAKLSEKPSTEEEEYIANLKAIFESGGNAAIIKKAIMQSMAPAGPVGMTDEEIRKGTEEAVGKEITPGTPEFAKEVKRRSDEIKSQRAVLRAQEVEQRGTAADALMLQALTGGDVGRKAQARLAEVQFPEQHLGLVRELAGVTPEVMQRADQKDRDDDEKRQLATEAGVLRKKHRQNQREADAEARGFAERFKAEEDAKEERIDAEVERNDKDMDRIVHGYKRRGEQQRIAAQAKADRQAHAQQVHGARLQERAGNESDEDVVRGRAEIRENTIQSARDRGESKEVIADMLQMSRQAAKADAADREFWRRERAKYVESVMGGGQN